MRLRERCFPCELREVDRTIWRIALPCVLENLLTFAATLIIAAMIGRLTADEISAQGIGTRITGVMQSLFKGIGVGGTIVIGTLCGMGSRGRCRKTAEELMLVSLAISIVLCILVVLWPRPLLCLFSDNEELIELAVPYVRVAVWMIPSFAVSRMITAAFNGEGNTRTPMVIAVTMNIINAIAGYLLIFAAGLGLIGAAFSLVFSNFCGMIIGLAATYHPRRGLYGGLRRDSLLFHAGMHEVGQSFSAGLPASCENMMWSAVAIIMTRALLSYDTVSNAGYQLASQVEEFLASPCFGFQLAATTLLAQSSGRRDEKGAHIYHKRISFWAVIVSLPAVLILVLLPRLCMTVLTDKPPIQNVGAAYLVMAGLAYIPQTLSMIDFGAIRVKSSKLFPLIVTVIGMWGIRVPAAVLSAWVFDAPITYVFAGIAMDQVVRWVISLLYRWRKRLFWGKLPARD